MKTVYFTLLCVASIFSLAGCSDKTQTSKQSSEPITGPSAELNALAGFAGTYIIIDSRRASDVAAPLTEISEADNPIGKSVRFTRHGIEMEGISCTSWKIRLSDNAVLFVKTDPNLIDLNLRPADSLNSVGDRRAHAGYEITCEGEHFATIHKVDDRVLIMPWANSAINLILEKPLSSLQIKAYQAQLKSMNFYDGPLSGELDAATLRGSRLWYEYRANPDETEPIPARPAITENLLDGLSILRK